MTKYTEHKNDCLNHIETYSPGASIHSHCCASITSIRPQSSSFCKIQTLLIQLLTPLPALGDHCLMFPFVILFCCWLSFTSFEEPIKGSLSQMLYKGGHTYRPDPATALRLSSNELFQVASTGSPCIIGADMKASWGPLSPNVTLCSLPPTQTSPSTLPSILTRGKIWLKKNSSILYTQANIFLLVVLLYYKTMVKCSENYLILKIIISHMITFLLISYK